MPDCASCGRSLTATDAFCPRCGTPVTKVTSAEEQTQVKPSAKTPRCTSCGTDLPEGARFCAECGSPMEAESAPPKAVSQTDPFADILHTADTKATEFFPPSPAVAASAPETPQTPRHDTTHTASTTKRPTTAPLQNDYPPLKWQDSPKHDDEQSHLNAGYQPIGSSSPIGDYLAFRKMITPSLIQIVFWLMEALSLVYWIFMIVMARFTAWGVIMNLLGLVVSAILIRVFLEIIIVIFRIQETTASIEKKLDSK